MAIVSISVGGDPRLPDSMSHPAIRPVILCGGRGSRLWPVSHGGHTKPFASLIGDRTLFERAIDRITGDPRFADPLVVAGRDHLPAIEAQMQSRPFSLAIEPSARGTAPAIAFAATLLPPDEVMLVCPADHLVGDVRAFRDAAFAAADLARRDRMVALAVRPDRPATRFGYIRLGDSIGSGHEIAQFVEKPDGGRARAFLASGDYVWNSGIFVFRAGTVLDEIVRHRPQMAHRVSRAVAAAERRGSGITAHAREWNPIESESIDCAVMEHTDRAAAVVAAMDWSDIGTWGAVHGAVERD